MIRTVLKYFCLIFLFLLVACKEDDERSVTPVATTDVTTLNVDVILPAAILAKWQPTIDWALENIDSAQLLSDAKVRLNLRYHNEDTSNLDSLGYHLMRLKKGADTCHAIIGPYYSAHAENILGYADRNRVPVIMPTCTSSELQRKHSRDTFAWFLTESDITQCEIMLAGAAKIGGFEAALIYSDDIYGQSFRDWFGYYATEQQVGMAGEGLTAYAPGDDLADFLNSVYEGCQSQRVVICIALSDAAHYAEVTEQVRQWTIACNENGKSLMVEVIFTDTALDDQVLQQEGIWFGYGISPAASPNFGFPQHYESRFNKPIQLGEAQVYDALMLLALGAAHQQAHGTDCQVAGKQVEYGEDPRQATLTDHIRSIVAADSGMVCGWNATSLAHAFSEVAAGRDIQLTGASGSLTFDEETHTKVLGTNYMFWKVDDGDGENIVKPVFYISTEGSSTQASTTSIWEMDKKWNPTYDDISVNHKLPNVSDHWAVVISPSVKWSNYRHQADAFAMYQTLRHHGYDDDHIVLIVEDNLADAPRNVFPGEIFVERSNDSAAENDPFINDNVRKNAVVDYHFSDLRPEDLLDIMTGQSSDWLPHVIHPTKTSNVFFFWSGHGGSLEGPLWGDEDAIEFFGMERIRDIVERMGGEVPFSKILEDTPDTRRYRRMMFAIETCFSGRWGEALTDMNDVLVLTSANSMESSKVDIFDNQLGVYLSNAFARTFRKQVDARNDITIYNLYRELFKTTRGSHVGIYNQQQYGSVYQESMREFLPE